MGATYSASGGGGSNEVRSDADPALVAKARSDPAAMKEEEWKGVLSRVQFAVTRKQGTEPAFNGHLWNNKQKGEGLQCLLIIGYGDNSCCDRPLIATILA